jgi:hypothetical protein
MIDMHHICGIIDDAAEMDTILRTQILYQIPTANFLPLVQGPGNPMADENKVSQAVINPQEKNVLFLKKKNQKDFDFVCAGPISPAESEMFQRPRDAKVFWFFSSEKNKPFIS